MKKMQHGDTLNLVKTAKNLKKIRKSHNETQVQLALKLGCTQSTIAKFERGEIQLSLKIAVDICALYGLSMDELIVLNDEEIG